MTKYKVVLSKNILEVAIVEVEAESVDEALEAAFDEPLHWEQIDETIPEIEEWEVEE